ncbi:MAG: hypothetical protein Sapg2KO_05520 [Saprospiraceae bacterium]
MKKGDLEVGIRVTKDGKNFSIDSLCKGYDPITNVPIDLVVPEGSSIGLITSRIKAQNVIRMINNQEPNYINQPAQRNSGYSMSASAGSTNSYAFIDRNKKDTLKIEWTVGYDPLQLLDLYPASYLTDYVAFSFKNIFEKYPDTVRYDWSKLDYIQNLDERGLPITPTFPNGHEGLFFVVYLTENAVVQMKGYHDKFHQVDTDNPLDLFLYEDLKPGDYEFIAKPYEDAPERLWLKYPFTIEKPWWQKQRNQLLIGFLISLVLIAAAILIVLAIQKRKEKELRWKQQITDAELKAIRAQLNPHFLFNALNSIQNLVTQQKNEQANSYITKLSRLLRQVLSSSERQFQELKEERQLIQLYLELEQLRYPFTFQINIDDNVDQHTLVPVMLLQPYVENAVKHGVAGNPDGKITLKISTNSEQLLIEITDNGPGLSIPKSNSAGLALGHNRIHHLNNLYSTEAAVEVKNRATTKGVIVKISLPIS